MLSFIKKHKIIFSLLAGLVVILILLTGLQVVNYHKIALGTKIAGQNFGGLKYAAAKEKINDLIKNLANQPIKITFGQKSWSALPNEIGVEFDPEKTLARVYSFGHDESLLRSAVNQVRLLFAGKDFNVVFWQDSQKLTEFAKNNFADLENPPQNANWFYSEVFDDFVFVPPKNGEAFDIENLKNQISDYLTLSGKKIITLKKIAQAPAVVEDKNNLAKTKAKNILAQAPFYLNYNSAVWPIEKNILANWFEFTPFYGKANQTMDVTFSQSDIEDYLTQLTPGINKEPVNGQLTIENGRVKMFALSQNGRRLNLAKSAEKITQEIFKGNKNINLVIDEIEPEISSKTIDTLGLLDLIGEGTSNFAGSPKNRIHNINIGATKFNGILIKPGEEFSFNKNLGEISAAQGYLPELVIKGNKTIPEYGGGICQVSTTLFRAAVYAGLKITERYPHAFAVRYYSPQGFDATVYPPHPDLRFVNDTPAHILIQSKIEGTKITFELYGTKDNRQIKVIGPTVLSSNSDGSMKTVLTQEIWRNGQLERKQQFWSNYKSPALYPIEKNPLE